MNCRLITSLLPLIKGLRVGITTTHYLGYNLHIMNKQEEIKAFRKKHRLSQRQLSELLKVNWRTVQRWEAGDRNPSATAMALLQEIGKNLTTTKQADK